MKELKEALIGKNNDRNALTKNSDLFIIDAYGDFYRYCIKNYSHKKIGSPQEEIFILDLNEIKDILDNVKKDAHLDLRIYPIKNLSRTRYKNLKDDLVDTRHFSNIVDKYDLKEISIEEL